MNIKIGAIIKKLRTENNITQDTLATAIANIRGLLQPGTLLGLILFADIATSVNAA